MYQSTPKQIKKQSGPKWTAKYSAWLSNDLFTFSLIKYTLLCLWLFIFRLIVEFNISNGQTQLLLN